MRYESEQDVKTRLQHSVVMYKKRPMLVIGVEDKNTLVVQDLLTERAETAPIGEVDLDPSHAPLGYIMEGEDVYLAMRKPVRRYKQGLNQENLLVKPVLKAEGRRMGRINFHSKSIGRAMLGQYPSVEDAFQSARNRTSELVPFSRDWAVGTHDEELSLVFRGEVVGFVLDESVKLLPERFYLKESLEVALNV